MSLGVRQSRRDARLPSALMATLLAQARVSDEQLTRGEPVGSLHGFPYAVKDLIPVKGLRMTMGSPILKDFIPAADSVMAERLRRAGAIFIGRTNTPEFGLGSNTYNPVYGITRNAYDQSRSAGGSSGGAAVALALRMLPVPTAATTVAVCAIRQVGTTCLGFARATAEYRRMDVTHGCRPWACSSRPRSHAAICFD